MAALSDRVAAPPRVVVAVVCAAVVSGLCGASACASTCPSSGLTPSLALHDAIPRIVEWEQSENLSPITIRESRRAMQTEKPKKLECSGNVCVIEWRAWPVSVWCSDGRLGVGIGGPNGSPWATIPFGPVLFWNSLPG